MGGFLDHRSHPMSEDEPKTESVKELAEKLARIIRRATWRRYSAEEKVRIVLEGPCGEDSIAELYPREGISQNLYYLWSKEFLETGKKRPAGDTVLEATSGEVKAVRLFAERELSRQVKLQASNTASQPRDEFSICSVASRNINAAPDGRSDRSLS